MRDDIERMENEVLKARQEGESTSNTKFMNK